MDNLKVIFKAKGTTPLEREMSLLGEIERLQDKVAGLEAACAPDAFSENSTTGTQTVTDAAEFLYEHRFRNNALMFRHNRRRYLVGLTLLWADEGDGPPQKEFGIEFAKNIEKMKQEKPPAWATPPKPSP